MVKKDVYVPADLQLVQQALATTQATTQLTLKSTADWDTWYALLQDRTSRKGVWKYCDPEGERNEEGEFVYIEPIKPIYPSRYTVEERLAEQEHLQLQQLSVGVGTRSGATAQQRHTTDPRDFDLIYKELQAEYEENMAQWRTEKDTLARLVDEIPRLLSIQLQIHIIGKHTMREILQSLKRTVAPTQSVREDQLLREWATLTRPPRNLDSLEVWFTKWETVFGKCQVAGVLEVTNRTATRKFLDAVQPLHETGITAMKAQIYSEVSNTSYEYDFLRTVQQVRNFLRQELPHKQAQHGSFHIAEEEDAAMATFQGQNLRDRSEGPERNKLTNPYVPRKGSGRLPPKCICGSLHWYSDCPYLYAEARTDNWRPNLKVEKQVDKWLEDNQDQMEKILKGATKFNKTFVKKRTDLRNNNRHENYTAGFLATESVMSIHEKYALAASTILDSGATCHVTNSCTDLTEYQEAHESEELWAGGQKMRIEGYGTRTIQVTVDGNVRPLHLLKVAYIPAFQTNIASLRKFIEKGVEWDTKRQKLVRAGEVIADTPMALNQWVLEYKGVEQVYYNSHTPRKATGTVEIWHQRTGHLHHNAVLKLPQATRGAEVIGTAPKDGCETCRLSKSKRIVSRRPTERLTTPYVRVHFDLIPMNMIGTGECWILHFVDDCTRMNHLYTLHNKKQTTMLQNLRGFAAFVKRQFGINVRTWRTDGEASLGGEVDTWIRDEGYTLERSAPYTQEQNGLAEASGYRLTVIATALKGMSKFPASLWPEMYKTAAYILNRSPTQVLAWETPYGELQKLLGVQDYKPDVSHLRVYGCRAYVHIQNRKKLDRLEPRAQIGYLIGYNSTNIFRIWIPQLDRVIVSRDVVFDETKTYDPAFEHQHIQQIIELLEGLAILPDEEGMAGQPKQRTDLSTTQTTQESAGNSGREHPTASSSQEKQDEAQGSYGPEKQATGEGVLLTPEATPEPSSRRERYVRELAETNTEAIFTATFLQARTFTAEPPKIHRSKLPEPPTNWQEVLKHEHTAGFKTAAAKELNDLWNRDTFKPVRMSDINGKFVIPVKWVFNYKFNKDGNLNKYKARLVVRGDLQPRDPYEETYAATLGARIIRALLAIAAYFDLDIYQMDAVSAFTNSNIDEEVYVRYPAGFEKPGFCLKLQRALYGLRSSPLLWYKDFTETLESLGLVRIPEAHCLYVGRKIVVFFYVDDVCILSRKEDKEEAEEFRKKLLSTYEFQEIGELKYFLGIRVLRDREKRKIWLCQDAYVQKLVDTFKLQHGPKLPKTPMAVEPLLAYRDTATPESIHLYQKKIGFINYAAVTTRPDIARAAQKLAQFNLNPSKQHHEAADRCILYLQRTKALALEFGQSSVEGVLHAYSDASYADNEDRKSTEGYTFTLFGGTIDWRCTKQRTVTTSTTEAELLSLSHCAAQLMWWRRFFNNINLKLDDEATLYCDNMQTVRLVVKDAPKLVTKLKHVDVHNLWLRQEVERKNVRIDWIPTNEMVADGFTKPLPDQAHQIFLNHLNMVDVASKIND